METVFKELVKVNLSHNYYSDKVLPDFTIKPTAACKRSLKNYGLLFRQSKNGFILLTQTEGTNSSTPLKSLENAGKFSLILFIKNPFLTNFTNLPINIGSKQFYHYSNLVNNQQNSELLLTNDLVNEYASEKDLIYLKPKRFLYSELNANASASVQISDIKSQSVLLETEKTKDGKLFYDVDLVDFPNGRYKLFVDGVFKLDFYADDSLYSLKPFAVIDIYINDSLPLSYKLIDSNGDITSKTYHIKFNKRKTHWKYFVVLKNRKSIDPANLAIEYPDNTNSFNKGSEVTLSDNDKAVPFTSQNEIDFSEEVLKGIQLKKTNGNSSGWFDIENLPNASIRNVKPDLQNNKVYSEIYVYI